MKAKRKIGAGCGVVKVAVKAAKKAMKENVKEKDSVNLDKKCVAAARKSFRKNNKKVPRVIPIPKTGGMIPLIPIFAGLSALDALTGGVANMVKTVGEFNRSITSHLGKGLYLTPHKGGSYKIEKGCKGGMINNKKHKKKTNYDVRYPIECYMITRL